jgi:hypothetical protein
MRKSRLFGLATVSVLFGIKLVADNGSGNSLTFSDPTGVLGTITTNPSFDFNSAFFQSLGTNGRTCGTCHVASDAWTIAPPSIQQRFKQSNGQDPLFRTNDGSNCANADVSTPAKAQAAYSLLLNKGLIRVQLPIPANAEFTLVSADDPYSCPLIPGQVSVYRRVLPATNLGFLSTVMWDGRETFAGQTISGDLQHQAIDATLGHAQAAVSPTTDQLNSIVAFELGTFTAQVNAQGAGSLSASGGLGGPGSLSQQPFAIGVNDPFQPNFNPVVFTIYDQFGVNTGSPAQASIRNGEAIFNNRTFTITDVGGLPTPMTVTCTVCHDTPNSGNHSVTAPLNIGLTDASRRTPDLPLFTFYCPATQQTVQTTDPGRALISGKCADIGKFKGPILRGIAARAPYFHNGSAASLQDAVNFYDTRFQIGFSSQDKSDLVAFLSSL